MIKNRRLGLNALNFNKPLKLIGKIIIEQNGGGCYSI
jgi:hypothetical protein